LPVNFGIRDLTVSGTAWIQTFRDMVNSVLPWGAQWYLGYRTCRVRAVPFINGWTIPEAIDHIYLLERNRYE
jgi:hypothetical protein